MFTDLPLEIIGEIAGKSREAYLGLIRAYPAFARSLTLGDRLDFAEKFGYDCRVVEWIGKDSMAITWFLNNKVHRMDGPAAIWPCGSKLWCRHNERHRTDGPALERADGCRIWYVNGKHHRVDGPAIEKADGYKAWYRNGVWHRTDGPAIEYANGSKSWYVDGRWRRAPQ